MIIKESKILNFIKKFQNKETINVFTSGCCYWFARILFDRFHDENDTCNIMIDYIENHFGCQIEDKVYDVTGDVTDKYKWEYWDHCTDDDLKKCIIRDCINF